MFSRALVVAAICVATSAGAFSPIGNTSTVAWPPSLVRIGPSPLAVGTSATFKFTNDAADAASVTGVSIRTGEIHEAGTWTVQVHQYVWWTAAPVLLETFNVQLVPHAWNRLDFASPAAVPASGHELHVTLEPYQSQAEASFLAARESYYDDMDPFPRLFRQSLSVPHATSSFGSAPHALAILEEPHPFSSACPTDANERVVGNPYVLPLRVTVPEGGSASQAFTFAPEYWMDNPGISRLDVSLEAVTATEVRFLLACAGWSTAIVGQLHLNGGYSHFVELDPVAPPSPGKLPRECQLTLTAVGGSLVWLGAATDDVSPCSPGSRATHGGIVSHAILPDGTEVPGGDFAFWYYQSHYQAPPDDTDAGVDAPPLPDAGSSLDGGLHTPLDPDGGSDEDAGIDAGSSQPSTVWQRRDPFGGPRGSSQSTAGGCAAVPMGWMLALLGWSGVVLRAARRRRNERPPR